jgi:hypothetical protein
MEKKQMIFVVGIAALLVLGLVMAVNATEQGKAGFLGGGCLGGGFGMHMRQGNTTFFGSLGLSENATREEINDAMWAKQLKDFGLTEDSTLGEYRQAVRAKMQANPQERMQKMRESLNLPENATQEDIQNLMKQRREENKGTFQGRGHRPGFGMWRGMGAGR